MTFQIQLCMKAYKLISVQHSISPAADISLMISSAAFLKFHALIPLNARHFDMSGPAQLQIQDYVVYSWKLHRVSVRKYCV